MNYDLISEALACPVCGAGMELCDGGHIVRCRGARTHSFDVAASDYLNLAGPKQSFGGDSCELVRARRAFLSGEYYKPFSDAVLSAVSGYTAKGTIIDAGCGEGYYSIKIAGLPGCRVLGIDLSKYAVAAAAKAAKRAGVSSLFCVAGIFSMPLRDGCADAVVNLFAPCAEEEFSRVLRPGGYLIVACAGPRHLYELKSLLYEKPTLNEPRADLPTKLTPIDKICIKFDVKLKKREDIAALFTMTPYFYRTSKADAERIAAISKLDTSANIDLYIYKKEFM